jgi:hypothetical protein
MRLGRADGNRETLLFDFPAIKLSSGSPYENITTHSPALQAPRIS